MESNDKMSSDINVQDDTSVASNNSITPKNKNVKNKHCICLIVSKHKNKLVSLNYGITVRWGLSLKYLL